MALTLNKDSLVKLTVQAELTSDPGKFGPLPSLPTGLQYEIAWTTSNPTSAPLSQIGKPLSPTQVVLGSQPVDSGGVLLIGAGLGNATIFLNVTVKDMNGNKKENFQASETVNVVPSTSTPPPPSTSTSGIKSVLIKQG